MGEMTEHPILFNGEMVRAILDGRKTQTRRVIKPQPFFGESGVWFPIDGWIPLASDFSTYGHPGDLLWVRETFADAPVGYIYKADFKDGHGQEVIDLPTGETIPLIWNPSIYMPRWASRITLEIVNVRVERVKDISQIDAKAEGADPWFLASDGFKETEHGGLFSIENCPEEKRDYRKGFQLLWDSINAKRGYGWDINSWVWAITFKKLEPA